MRILEEKLDVIASQVVDSSPTSPRFQTTSPNFWTSNKVDPNFKLGVSGFSISPKEASNGFNS